MPKIFMIFLLSATVSDIYIYVNIQKALPIAAWKVVDITENKILVVPILLV